MSAGPMAPLLLSWSPLPSLTHPPSQPNALPSATFGEITKFTTPKSSNSEEFQKRIPLNSHRDIFRDAIIITRKLGIQFIWIDRLCIV